MSTVGACCVCNAQEVLVSRVIAYGIETFACDECRGIEPESEPEHVEVAPMGETP